MERNEAKSGGTTSQMYFSFSKFSDVLMDDLPEFLPPCRKVDHKIKVVHGSILLAKAPYRLNRKELEELKTQINNLLNWWYVKQNKLFYWAPTLFVTKRMGS
jgi:hypothetical protein